MTGYVLHARGVATSLGDALEIVIGSYLQVAEIHIDLAARTVTRTIVGFSRLNFELLVKLARTKRPCRTNTLASVSNRHRCSGPVDSVPRARSYGPNSSAIDDHRARTVAPANTRTGCRGRKTIAGRDGGGVCRMPHTRR